MKRYGRIAALLAVVPLLAFGPAERTTPTYWALLVGISDYINFGDEVGGDLPGAEHDARVMRDVLVERWGFPPENVRMLLNQEATRAAIVEAMTEWLPANARPGDHITIFYAGHGSQMWDESGDEDDGLDETIAPADVRAEITEFDISDDELREWLAALPTDNVVVFLDNCSSGTGTRAVTPFSRTRQLARDVRALEKPPTLARRALTDEVDRTGFDSSDGRVLEISAAQPNQAAVDAYFPGDEGTEPFNGGAFTTFLVRQLWMAPSSATYEQIYRQVSEALKRNRFEQDPYLAEDVPLKRAPLFFLEGRSGGAADASLRVLETDGETALLGGGAALGITTGSYFETPGGARLVVEEATQERTTVRVLDGTVAEGDRARLTGYRFPRPALRVNVGGVDTRTASALAAALADVDDIVLVENTEEFAHLILRRRQNEIRVVGMDGAVRHTFPAGAEGSEDLAAILRMEAAAKRLGDMENPAPSFGLEVWLAGGKTSFGVGEAVTFHARAERDGYLTLVDLGTDGTVTVLFPNPYDRDNRVRGGQEIVFPSPEMESEIRALPPVGRGLVRAFLTQQPLDVPVGEDFTTGDVLLADRIADAVREAAGAIPGAPGAVRLDGWASASVVYEIRQ